MAKPNRVRRNAGITAAAIQTSGNGSQGQDYTVDSNDVAPSGNFDGDTVLAVGDDGTEYRQLVNEGKYYQAQQANYKGSSFDVKAAMQSYVDDQPDSTAKGNDSLYSKAQNLNHALSHGMPLNANQKMMYGVLQGEMHPLGGNYVLYRYDHDAYADALLHKVAGINQSYQNMTNAQIKQAFVGMQFTDNKFVSTSCNNFAKAGASASTFTSRAVEIHYLAKSDTQALAMRQGGGGNQGEIVLGYGQKYTIKNAYTTGQTRRTKGTQSYGSKHLVLEIEVG